MKENTTNGAHVEIRVRSKATNAILARYADKCGGAKEAALELGVCYNTFCSWLNFKTSLRPSRGKGSKGGLRAERVAKIIFKLEQETGRSIKDIFPLSKDEMRLLEKARIKDHVVPREKMLDYVNQSRAELTYEAQPSQWELVAAIPKVLKELSCREKMIIELRYGLNGKTPHTLEETAKELGVTRERARQLESMAIRKLQNPELACQLVGHLD